MPHFDWTITLGDVLKMIGFFAGIMLVYGKLVRFATRIEWMMDNFPPHKHVGEDVIYPRGMEPQ